MSEKVSQLLKLAGFTLVVHRREYPETRDDLDGGWLVVTCTCRATGSFVEAKGALVRVDELHDLLTCLESLYNGSQTKFELNCLEPELSLHFEVATTGQIAFEVRLTPDNLKQSHSVEFDIDLSYLPSVIEQCRSILKIYPIINGQVGQS